jgi:hypothetical protein
VSGFRATLRISEVIDGNRAFVEWWANFECAPDRRDELTGTARGAFAKCSNRCGWRLWGRARVCLKHRLVAVNPWFGTNSAALALIPSEFFGFRTIVRLLHSHGAFGIGLPLVTAMRRRQPSRTRV